MAMLRYVSEMQTESYKTTEAISFEELSDSDVEDKPDSRLVDNIGINGGSVGEV